MRILFEHTLGRYIHPQYSIGRDRLYRTNPSYNNAIHYVSTKIKLFQRSRNATRVLH